MNFKTFISIILVASAISLQQSCSDLEEYTDQATLKNRIQNEGYLPLSPDNLWVYENWIAKKNSDGSYTYDSDKIKSEHTIKSVGVIKKDQEVKYEYGFSLIDLGDFIGGFLGNFDKITKINDQYFKQSIIKVVTKNPNGTKNEVLKYKLDDQMFLTDDVEDLAPDDNDSKLINTHTGKYGKESEGFYMEYEITRYAKKIDRLPENLVNNIGIDDHLRNYENILHITDITKITKLIFTSAGGSTIDLKGSFTIPKNSSFIDASLDAKTNASGSIYGTLFSDQPWLFPVNVFSIDVRGGYSGVGYPFTPILGPYIRLYDALANLAICPSEGVFDNTITIKAAKYELISNQPVSVTDSYWVRGVGNIKTVTSPSKLTVGINLLSGTIDPIKVTLKSTEENCALNTTNTLQLSLDVGVNFNDAQIQIPISLGDTYYIQNLRDYRLRNSLN